MIDFLIPELFAGIELIIWAIVLIFLHEFGHFLLTVAYRVYDGFCIRLLYCGIKWKGRLPVQKMILILSAGFVFSFPTAAVLWWFHSFNLTYLIMPFFIAALDFLEIFTLLEAQKINPFFKYFTSDDRFNISLKYKIDFADVKP